VSLDRIGTEVRRHPRPPRVDRVPGGARLAGLRRAPFCQDRV